MTPIFFEKILNDKSQPLLFRKALKLAKQSRLKESLEQRCAAVDSVARLGGNLDVALFELMMIGGEAPLRYQRAGI